MNMYQLIQLSIKDLKNKRRATEDPKLRQKYVYAMLLKDVLTVGFALFFIIALNALFGSANSSASVVIFCLLLSVRFVNFGYRIQDSILSMFIVFAILTFSPIMASVSSPFLAFIIHFVSLFFILFLACDEAHMGNAGLYVFGYVFLSGSPVYDQTLKIRAIEMLLGCILCSYIFYRNHKTKQKERSIIDLIKEFRFSSPKCQWQLLVVIGVSFILFLGHLLDIPRAMWMGFACSSMLSAYQSDVKERMKDRIIGVILGSFGFLIVYSLAPDTFQGVLGIISGLCLGLCGEYRYSSLFNCFGALLIASSIYGVQGALWIRITNNIVGCILGVIIYFSYYAIMHHGPVSQRLIQLDEKLYNFFHKKQQN